MGRILFYKKYRKYSAVFPNENHIYLNSLTYLPEYISRQFTISLIIATYNMCLCVGELIEIHNIFHLEKETHKIFKGNIRTTTTKYVSLMHSAYLYSDVSCDVSKYLMVV